MPENILKSWEENYLYYRYLNPQTGKQAGFQCMKPGISEWNLLPEQLKSTIKNTGLSVWESSLIIFEQGKGIGPNLWVESEINLVIEVGPVVRYVLDSSDDDWTTRHIDRILNEVRRRGIQVNNLWRGSIDLAEGMESNNAWVYTLR